MSKEIEKKVTVFLSASDVAPVYKDTTIELVKLLVENGYTFVYGGTKRV